MIEQLRETMGKRLGEMITDLFGDDTLQSMYEKAGLSSAFADQMPSGERALQEGIISQDVKTALLVAQSAERTFQLALKAEQFLKSRDELSPGFDTQEQGYVEFDDPVFKYVGSDRDPIELQQAQTSWLASQMHLNREIDSLQAIHSDARNADRPYSNEDKYINGFKVQSAKLYSQAAELLESGGFNQEAENLKALAEASLPGVGEVNLPSEFLSAELFDLRRGRQAVIDILGAERYVGTEEQNPYIQTLIKLKEILPVETIEQTELALGAEDLTPNPGQ